MDSSVQENKDYLKAKQEAAETRTPEGMELMGWFLDGWLINSYTPFDAKARPIYAFTDNPQEFIGDFTQDQMEEIND